jgi:hypothetical protein
MSVAYHTKPLSPIPTFPTQRSNEGTDTIRLTKEHYTGHQNNTSTAQINVKIFDAFFGSRGITARELALSL